MTRTQYTSELAAKALKLQPVGAPHTGDDCNCAMCARLITKGDIAGPLKLSKSFADFQFLGVSGVICGWCEVTTDQKTMRFLQRSVITPNGIYNLNTDDARAWFWLTPPEPPFSVIVNHSTTAAFHFFWRTPVTLDAAVVTINIDGNIFLVRRARVLEALKCGRLLLDRAPELQVKKGAMKAPFVVLSRDPTKTPRQNNGHLHADAYRLAALHDDCSAAVRFLETLNPGELAALSPFLKQKPALPTQPKLITSIESEEEATTEVQSD